MSLINSFKRAWHQPKPKNPKEIIVNKDQESVYTVGVTPDGYTVLKLHAEGYMTTTLTLGAQEVRKLIKLLAVTIEPGEEVDNVDENQG